MRAFSALAALALIITSAQGLSTPHVLHEKRGEEPVGWIKHPQVPRGHIIPMRIGLTQSNLENAEEYLMKVSHPNSPHYADHYSAEEVVDIFAPTEGTIKSVKDWLQSTGIDNVELSANKQWLIFATSVENAEELFKTKYHVYQHQKTGKINVACDEYHLPHHIQEHVDYIMPGLRLVPGRHPEEPRLKKRALPVGPIKGNPLPKSVQNLTNAELLSMCNQFISPPCVLALYNITGKPKNVPGNNLGIFEEGDFYGKEDLAEFFTYFAEQIPVTTEPIQHGIDGGSDLSVATGESDLDFQLAYPLIYPQQAVLFQTDDINYALLNSSIGNGIFNTFLDAIDGSYCSFSAYGETGNSKIDPKYPDPAVGGYKGKLQCGVYKPTNVISFSYGLAEASLPTNYQRRQCLEYLKLGMQGTTMVFATQDAGVAARYAVGNSSNDCLNPNGTVFAPDFPANCPWVTAVGSTAFTGGDVHKDPEHATDQFGSGAGFSNVYNTPAYQASAVSTYLTKHEPSLTGYKSYNLTKPNAKPGPGLTKGGRFNRGGRGYPDLSAIGENILIILDNVPITVGGTSASTPVFAALVNRINGMRIAAGKKSVGFINPALYAHPGIFHDIITGNSPGCDTQGFITAPGWDPSTGLGTPNYPKLVKLLTSLK